MESTGKIETDRLSNCSDTESTGSSEKGPVTLQTPASTEVAKLLECPVCYDIVLPPIVLCSGGHHVCNTCRPQLQTCPTCRGTFTNVRDRFAEEFLDQICSIRCKYASQGCTVSLPGRQLVEHQSKCNFRPILCRECDQEIQWNKFLEHLRQFEKIETQRATECSTGFEIEEEEVSRPARERFSVWEPTWIYAHGHDFFCFLETSENQWWIWVGGYALPEVCSQFICSITVWNKEKQTEMKYVGQIHSIRSSPEEVLGSGKCLIFLDVNLRNFIYKGGIDVLVRIDRGEYQPPRTRKGTVVESPIHLFGRDAVPCRELASRANRVNRYMSRAITYGNDNRTINESEADVSAGSSMDVTELNDFED